MALGRGPRDQFILIEYRLVHSHIIVLIPHGKDIVVEDHISRIDLIAKIIQDVLTDRTEREGKDGEVLGLFEHLPFSVI